MQSSEEPGFTPILGGFIPIAALWTEARSLGPLFPSEVSARWYVRKHREALVEGEAIAIHLKKTYIHLERFQAVARQLALDTAKPRAESGVANRH
jgi:hypothetical protein